jgi:UDP-glucuronate 4-epimerase
MDFIRCLEKHVGKKARLEFKGMQAGDMQATYADTRSATEALGFESPTELDQGVEQLVSWCRDYY